MRSGEPSGFSNGRSGTFALPSNSVVTSFRACSVRHALSVAIVRYQPSGFWVSWMPVSKSGLSNASASNLEAVELLANTLPDAVTGQVAPLTTLRLQRPVSRLLYQRRSPTGQLC